MNVTERLFLLICWYTMYSTQY